MFFLLTRGGGRGTLAFAEARLALVGLSGSSLDVRGRLAWRLAPVISDSDSDSDEEVDDSGGLSISSPESPDDDDPVPGASLVCRDFWAVSLLMRRPFGKDLQIWLFSASSSL